MQVLYRKTHTDTDSSMSSDRRYNEEEIAAIFKAAAERQEDAKSSRSTGDGLTLSELQQIGKEAGITPEMIADAASSIGNEPQIEKQSTLLGMPTSVGRTVQLGGHLSEDGWSILVSQMRSTFKAHGKTDQMGRVRSWRNGNLQISVEPSNEGDILRMRTVKGDAMARLAGTLAGVLAVGALSATILSAGGPGDVRQMMLLAMILVGLGVFAMPILKLKTWARERGEQMEVLAVRAGEMAHAPQSPSAPQIEKTASGILDMEAAEEEMNDDATIVIRDRSRI